MKNVSVRAGIISAVVATVSWLSINVFATSTTYTFSSEAWKSAVGSVVCDGVTDGWLSDKAGSSYDSGRTYADGSLHGAGVKVEKAATGAGATSVIVFENVRKVVVNFCVTSNGNGEIAVTIGDTTMVAKVNKGMKNKDVTDGYSLNEDIEFPLQTSRTGQVSFAVQNVTKSSVYIRSITIKADNGSGDVFSTKVYHLVTNVNQLKDSDLIMIGVADGKTNKALGYFDTDISKNNIHAVSAKYDSEREYINANEEVTYILRTAVSEKGKEACFVIYDPFAEAYLVASGGRTKNALRIWDKLYDPNTYGDFGYWDIQVAEDGQATIMCLGNSLGKYIQYNPTFDLFGCYQQETMTAVSIYRQEEAKDLTQPMIVVPMVQFGTAVMRGETELEGSKTIEVKANRLTEDIEVSLKEGTVFGLSASQIDRDGDKLTIIYKVSKPGKYVDTLTLRSGELVEQVPVVLNVAKELTIAEAVQSKDFEYIYLNPLTVTKKYDRQVYVRDATGSMMLYDEGPDNARFAKDLAKGHVLREVEGKFQNYWGVPELHLMAQPKCNTSQPVECLPDTMTVCADSADVCRYIFYEKAPIVYAELLYEDGSAEPWPAVQVGEETLLLSEWFTLPDKSESIVIIEDRLKAGETYLYDIEGIVSYDYDDVVLYPTFITLRGEPDPEGIEEVESLELKVESTKVLRDGTLYILREGEIYTILGRESK